MRPHSRTFSAPLRLSLSLLFFFSVCGVCPIHRGASTLHPNFFCTDHPHPLLRRSPTPQTHVYPDSPQQKALQADAAAQLPRGQPCAKRSLTPAATDTQRIFSFI